MFCGASSGSNPLYIEAARLLGAEMARRGIGLVYGCAPPPLPPALSSGLQPRLCHAPATPVTGQRLMHSCIRSSVSA